MTADTDANLTALHIDDTVTRRAPQPMLTRKGWKPGARKITGQFQMTRAEARKLWSDLIKDGAFRA